MKRELHPLCTFFPRLADDEFEALKADIAANGQTHPIYTLDGMILDGGNRYRALAELGIEPRTVEYTGGNPVQFVLSSNLRRRHLSPGQAAAIVSATQDWGKAHVAGSNQHQAKSSGPATLPDHMATVADRAEVSGAGERTQRMADKLVKEAPPELVKEVTEGRKSLPKALEEIDPKPRKAKPAPEPAEPPTQEGTDAPPPPAQKPVKPSELEAENERLKKQVAALEAQNQEAFRLVDELQAEVESLSKILDAGDREAEWHAEIKRLTSALANMTWSRDEYMNGKAALTRELKAKNRKIEHLEKRNKELQAQLDGMKEGF